MTKSEQWFELYRAALCGLWSQPDVHGTDAKIVAETAKRAADAAMALVPKVDGPRPRIVCLCGSTRFCKAFDEANYRETLAGHIVLSIGCVTASDRNLGITPEQKVAFDELHKWKINMADEVLVLNVGGYIGESTRSEIDYARAHSKPIRWLEDVTQRIDATNACREAVKP